jgi:hypothetical protein
MTSRGHMISRPHRDIRGVNAVEEDGEGLRISVRLWPPWRTRSIDVIVSLLIGSVEIIFLLERAGDNTDVFTRSTLESCFLACFCFQTFICQHLRVSPAGTDEIADPQCPQPLVFDQIPSRSSRINSEVENEMY